MTSLTSADLFSGAGGLTEGFHQAGYEVLASLDNWAPAAETHARNYPKTEMFHADGLEFEPSELPKVDVLIGSPPCTEFSYTNQGGHGDLGLGREGVEVPPEGRDLAACQERVRGRPMVPTVGFCRPKDPSAFVPSRPSPSPSVFPTP